MGTQAVEVATFMVIRKEGIIMAKEKPAEEIAEQPQTEVAQDPTPIPAKLTPDEIMARIAEASTKGDIAEVVRLGNLLKKETKAVEEAENARLLKEAKELAGEREALAKDIHSAVITGLPQLLAQLKDVKATGFTFKLDGMDAQGVKISYKSVELTVPKPKAKGSSTTAGTGVRTSTKDSIGMSLSELIDKYATDEEKAGIREAYDKAEKSPGSAKWTAQNKVKADILKRNPELVK